MGLNRPLTTTERWQLGVAIVASALCLFLTPLVLIALSAPTLVKVGIPMIESVLAAVLILAAARFRSRKQESGSTRPPGVEGGRRQ